MPYPEFDLSRVSPKTTEGRAVMTADDLLPLDAEAPDGLPEVLRELGAELVKARNQGGATVFLCDASIVSDRVSLHLIDLMEKGLLTHLVIESFAAICDWELAITGQISTTFAKPVQRIELVEQFQTCLAAGDADGCGYGESLGRRLFETNAPLAERSLLAQGYRWGVPVTVHGTAGGDFLQATPSFDPSLFGRSCHRDFLLLCNSVENLDDGVIYQFDNTPAAAAATRTALALARSAAQKHNREIIDFTTAVFTEEVPAGSETVADDLATAGSHVVAVDTSTAITALRHAALKAAGWPE